MSRSHHSCSLPVRDTSGLPKLPPNASCMKRMCRYIRKLFLLNPGHYKCKTLFRNKSSVLAERKRHATSPYAFVIHPLSAFSAVVEALFFLTWFYSLVCDPLLVFTDSIGKGFRFMQSQVIFPIQVVLIMLLFDMGYIDGKTKEIIIDPKRIIKRYVTTFFVLDLTSTAFLIHLMAIFTKMGYILCTVEYHKTSACFEMMYLFRIICCLCRINTLLRFLCDTLANMHVRGTTIFIIRYVVKTYMYIHVFSFLLYFTPYLEHRGAWPEGSWLKQAGLNHQGPVFTQYSECIVMTFCYFFGISYRYDITLPGEQILVSLISIFGRLYTLYLLADILNVFGIVGVSESMYERQLVSLQKYMTEKDLPESLRQRMIKYYEFKFQKRYFRENEILLTLSGHLRTEMFLFAARKLVQKVEFFKKLPNSTLGAIIAAMKSETYSPRDIIIKLGSEIEDIFFISNGTVAVMNRFGTELCHLEDGDVFGSSCILLREQIYFVMAVETTEVFSINKNLFLDFLAPHQDVMSIFQLSVKQRLAYLKNLEDKMLIGTVNLLTELHRGNILETRTKRLIAQ